MNQIGGKNPNYHFDYGFGDKITIGCTKEQAEDLKEFLYKQITSLVVMKKWAKPEKKDEYYHVAVLDGYLKTMFASYSHSYTNQEGLVEKLTITHDFIDDMFQSSEEDGLMALKYLLQAFSYKDYHLSEIKTLLVISKPFKDLEAIKPVRERLFEIYEAKKKQEVF